MKLLDKRCSWLLQAQERRTARMVHLSKYVSGQFYLNVFCFPDVLPLLKKVYTATRHIHRANVATIAQETRGYPTVQIGRAHV